MAPFVRPAHFNQAEDAIFGCPCGVRGNYRTLCGHRHGWKLRPLCNGPMFNVDPGSGEPAPPVSYSHAAELAPMETVDHVSGEIHSSPAPPPLSETDPSPVTVEDDHASAPAQPRPRAYEADPIDESGDEEEIARQVLSRRGISADPGALSWWQTAHQGAVHLEEASDEGGGGEGGGGDDELPPGDWRTEGPGLPTPQSQARESVVLPVQVRLMYDWMRGQGWHSGKDTLSDWVEDMLMDHWKYCLGMGIFILRREEVDVA